MIFLFDKKTGEVTAHKNHSTAIRAGLTVQGITIGPGEDPFQVRNRHEQDKRMILVNLSEAFRQIAESDAETYKILARKFYQAIEDYYK